MGASCKIKLVLCMLVILTIMGVVQNKQTEDKQVVRETATKVSVSDILKDAGVPRYIDFDVSEIEISKDSSETISDTLESESQISIHEEFISLNSQVQTYIWYECESKNINPYLVFAIIEKESQYDASAISSTGDYGLCQINESNFGWINRKLGYELDYMNAYDNVDACIALLSYLNHKFLNKYGDSFVIGAYNMGEKNMLDLYNQGIELTEYTSDVLDIYNRLQLQSVE